MKVINKKYIVKTWDELTEEEKQEKIHSNWEDLYFEWDNGLWDETMNCLNDLLSELKIIDFVGDVLDTFSFDDNSQSWWIERIKTKNINAFCDTFDFNEVDFDFGRRNQSLLKMEDIENTFVGCYCYFNQFQTDFESGYYNYSDLEIMSNTKNKNGDLEYKEFNHAWNEFKKEYNYFVEQFNKLINAYFDDRYDMDEYFIDNYFEDMEFEFFKEVVENED
jgi:hypothetical protein